ncbi:hypothetical protein HK102_000769 [Quaeritorhiza haematococci]|nr:hypothetical protein HK102_000769 [Quaeritorhiza haematococci]
MSSFPYRQSSYKNPPWETDNPDQIHYLCEKMLNYLKGVRPATQSFELMQHHQVHCAITTIYFSNLVEDAGSSFSDTYRLCLNVFTEKPVDSETVNKSGTTPKHARSRKEIVQHAQAFRFLQRRLIEEKRDLTLEDICEAHRILVNGLLREDGRDAQPGCLREEAVFAGYHEFIPHQAVKRSLNTLIDEFNDQIKYTDTNAFSFAAWVLFEFVSIHPFLDGNGHMCRMLMNMVLLKLGVPFPVAFGFSSGHHKAKSHYIQCIMDARKRGGKTYRLNVVVCRHFIALLARSSKICV